MLELEGLEDDDDGVELEPVPAEPLVPLEELGLELEDDAPPLDWLFCVSEGVLEELEGVLEELAEPLIEPDGLDGVVAPLDEDEDGEDGEVDDGLDEVAPVEEPLAPLFAPRSQAVSRVAPSAMETATAIVESLM